MTDLKTEKFSSQKNSYVLHKQFEKNSMELIKVEITLKTVKNLENYTNCNSKPKKDWKLSFHILCNFLMASITVIDSTQYNVFI